MVSPQAGPDGQRDRSTPRAERAARARACLGCVASRLGSGGSSAASTPFAPATSPWLPRLAELRAAFVLDYDPVPHGSRCLDHRWYVVPRSQLDVGLALEGLSESRKSIRPRRTLLCRHCAAPLRLGERPVGAGLGHCPHQRSRQPVASLPTSLCAVDPQPSGCGSPRAAVPKWHPSDMDSRTTRGRSLLHLPRGLAGAVPWGGGPWRRGARTPSFPILRSPPRSRNSDASSAITGREQPPPSKSRITALRRGNSRFCRRDTPSRRAANATWMC